MYDTYINTVENNIVTDPKNFWDFINKKKGSNKLPAIMPKNDETFTTGQEIAETFVDFFRLIIVAITNIRSTRIMIKIH